MTFTKKLTAVAVAALVSCNVSIAMDAKYAADTVVYKKQQVWELDKKIYHIFGR